MPELVNETTHFASQAGATGIAYVPSLDVYAFMRM